MCDELNNLITTHQTFVEWERIRQRADILANFFPIHHPLQRCVKKITKTLEDYRYRSELSVIEFENRYGRIVVRIGDKIYEDATDLFQMGKYCDWPTFTCGHSRPRELELNQLSEFHNLENVGKRFMHSVAKLPGSSKPNMKRHLKRKASEFENECHKMEKQLKRIKISPRQRYFILFACTNKCLVSSYQVIKLIAHLKYICKLCNSGFVSVVSDHTLLY